MKTHSDLRRAYSNAVKAFSDAIDEAVVFGQPVDEIQAPPNISETTIQRIRESGKKNTFRKALSDAIAQGKCIDEVEPPSGLSDALIQGITESVATELFEDALSEAVKE